jgi:beta-glucosidase
VSLDRCFPEGFLWGCATAAHQVEGNNHNCDWWEFEQQGGIQTGESADPACDHYNRFREDFRLLQQLNNNAHRLSIEWSRIEPTEGEFDQAQIRHYRDVLVELRERGMLPMVTLHHFTSPLWFTRRGGWAVSGSAEAWLVFVRRVAEELGDLVGMWCTINEPNIYAYLGWVTGEFPPGRHNDVAGMYHVLANMHDAHDLAYRELKRQTPQLEVGLAHNKWLLFPANPWNPFDRVVAAGSQFLLDRWPAGGRGRLSRVVEATTDYIGLNHYSGSLVSGLGRHFNPTWLAETDFGWAVQPGWLRHCLEELSPLGKPIYVTESGMAARDDLRRSQFLEDVLGQVWQAIENGVDVRGYLHWTSVDNFEWARGYSMRFGLIGVDLETQERTIKPSGHLFARIAKANALPVD